MYTIIQNGYVLTMDNNRRCFDTGYVVYKDDLIQNVGSGTPSHNILENAEQVIDAKGMAVLPGLINAHTHLFQTFLRGLGDDLPLDEWLRQYIWPVSANMGLGEARLTALLGLVENIHSGVTSIIDNQYLHNTPDMDDIYCQAAVDVGIRYTLARGWADRNYHSAFLETQTEIIERISSLVDRWKYHPSGRIRIEIGPLSQLRCSDETMKKTYQLSKDLGIGMHMHTSESWSQTESCINETGLRPVEWLESLGCLSSDFQIIHAVWLSDHELDLIAENQAKVVHCPVSNMYLASGIARIPEMHQRGISVALATDGPGSNNNQDMLETLKTTALLHKVNTKDARVFLPEDLLWMAICGGAEANGQQGEIGSLEPGKKADIILVDMNTSFAVPVHNPVSALVYNLHGSDVDTVIVDGKVLMMRKKLTIIDEQALLDECSVVAKHLINKSMNILMK